MPLQPSASSSFTMRLHLPQESGAFARVAHAIGDAEALLGAVDLVRVEQHEVVRDVTVACVDSGHADAVVAAVRELARQWGLGTGDKPAAACLASRIAYGVAITPGRLARVERAEAERRPPGSRTARGIGLQIIETAKSVAESPEHLAHVLSLSGVQCRILSGYYGGGSKRRLVKQGARALNWVISRIGTSDLRIAPFYEVYGRREDQHNYGART